MKIYKLTNREGCTRGGTQWGPGVRHEAKDPRNGGLCGPGWIHAYEDPLLAVLHDPIHGRYLRHGARLWECETDDADPLREGQMQIGVWSLTTMREIEVPQPSLEQRVRYAHLCAGRTCDRQWGGWARWSTDQFDRSSHSATLAAEEAATRAAAGAALAEEAAAAGAAGAALAEEAAARVEAGAALAAQAATAWVANRKAAKECPLEVDLISIAEEAMKEE